MVRCWIDLPFFKQGKLAGVRVFLHEEINQGKVLYPSLGDIWNAFVYTPRDSVKVCVLGQDPYFEGSAHGLAFSVKPGVALPPSLVNIFKEIKSDLGLDCRHGSLIPWAKQGVLLWNTALTVERGRANSHKGIWDDLTREVIETISQENPHIVFMLWGRNAASYQRFIHNPEQHLILKAAHPSPLSAHAGWFGCRHFSKANAFLEKPIDWQT